MHTSHQEWPINSIITVLIIALFALSGCGKQRDIEKLKVLCISDVPETTEWNYYQNAAAYIFQLEHHLTPDKLVSPQFNVKKVDWLSAGAQLEKINDYDVLILWDCPASITDSRNNDPYYCDLEIISNSSAERIIEFVKNGGGLIVAGGVTCYGDTAPLLGATADKGERRYLGYSQSPIADILPVIIEPGQKTLTPLNKKKQPFLRIIKPGNELTAGLQIKKWGCNAYHKVKTKENTDILCTLSNGDPLIVRSKVGNGKVSCVMLSPRGNNLLRDKVECLKNPLWPGESILWERLLRWTSNMEFDHSIEKKLIDNYSSIVSSPTAIPLSELQSKFPYAVHTLNQCLPENLRELTLKFYNQKGFNRIINQSSHVTSEQYLNGLQNDLADYNLIAFLHTDLAIEPKHHNIPPEKWAQLTLPSEKFALNYGDPRPCPYSEIVRKYASEKAERIINAVGDKPNIQGCVFDDEWAWVMGYRNPYEEGQGLACYSPWVNKQYEKITGIKPPKPVYREPGYVAPEDDPWLNWCKEIRQDAFYEYNERVKHSFKARRNDFTVCNYPGGFEGNLDIMIEEIYLDCWKESELETLERLDVRYNFRGDKYRDKYDIWSLIGIFRMPEDKSIYPETLRLTAGLCLGSGTKGIILWNAANLWAPNLKIHGRDPLYEEAKRLGVFLEKYGPMFKHLKKVPADIWVLSGWFWVNSFDNYYHLPPEGELEDKERPWWMFQVSDILVPAMLRSGLYVEFVTEKQLMSSEIFNKKAVVVPGMLYCRQAVVDKLNEYSRTSEMLFTDKSCRIELENKNVLPVDFSQWHFDVSAGERAIITPTEKNYRIQRAMREKYVEQAITVIKQHLTSRIKPNIIIDNTKACYTMLKNDNTHYLFVYNADTDNKNTVQVAIQQYGKYAYDIKSAKLVTMPSINQKPVEVNLKPGGWKVFALSDQRIESLEIQRRVFNDNVIQLSAKVLDSFNNIFSGAVPLEISLQGTTGESYKVYRAASQGNLETLIEVPTRHKQFNKIRIKELLTGKFIEEDLQKKLPASRHQH